MKKSKSLVFLFIIPLSVIYSIYHFTLPRDIPNTPTAPLVNTMTFTYAENGGNCGGCSFLLANGKITNDTPILFTSFMASLKKDFPQVESWNLYLNSPGGSVSGAAHLGELIRVNNINTAVGHAQRSNDPADYGAYEFQDSAICNAACVLAFAGGVHRFYGDATRSSPRWYVGSGRQLISLKGFSEDIANEINRAENKHYLNGIYDGLRASNKLIEYLSRMGVDTSLISTELTNPVTPDEVLSERQAYDIKLANVPTPPLTWTITESPTRIELRSSSLIENRNVHYRFFCSTQSSSRIALSIEIEKLRFISRADIDQYFNTAKWTSALSGTGRLDIPAEIIRTEIRNDNFRVEIGIPQILIPLLVEEVGLVLKFELPMAISRDFPSLAIHSPELVRIAPPLIQNCSAEQSRPNRSRR